MQVILIIVGLVIIVLLNAVIAPFPIGDVGTMSYGSLPWVTLGLIVVNSVVFIFWQYPDLYRADMGETEIEQNMAIVEATRKVWAYGSLGAAVREQTGIGAVSTLTGMFMHSHFYHLFSNMVFLWVFGRRVEDACGSWRFLLFYLLAGTVSSMAYYILITGDDVPSIGASGAISGVMGAYLVLFPGARIQCIWIGFTVIRTLALTLIRLVGIEWGQLRGTVTLRAFILLLVFLAGDLIDTFESAETRELVGGVNYVAHAGGFLSSVTILFFARKDAVYRYFAGRRL